MAKDDATMASETIDDLLNKDAVGLNKQQPGTGDPAGPPPAPQSVTKSIFLKPGQPSGVGSFAKTKVATITWTMPSPAPSDLLGFHVEVAGSPNGPWQRLTRSPVAWWERHYTAQGLAIDDACTPSHAFGHTECLSYRVIAVDASGNESAPAPASNNPSSASCPTTPNPPQNLRASAIIGLNGHCDTKLEWDAATGATEYYVHRYVMYGEVPYFYETARVTPGGGFTETYTEYGDTFYGSCPWGWCPNRVQEACATGYLDAFYVTARGASGGESPRSNLAFWKCGTPLGYARALPPSDPIGDPGPAAGELLACMERGDTWGDAIFGGPMAPALTERPTATPHPASPGDAALTVAPMARLGSVPDPAWTVYNLHTDHLGTVRATTDTLSGSIARNDYFPFGEEIASGFSFNTHQYTGHERDRESGLDYMLARYYGAGLGRFFSPDPAFEVTKSQRRPQRWNRYAYVLNNTLIYVDPQGETLTLTGSKAAVGQFVDETNKALVGKKLEVDSSGNATLVDDPTEQGPSTPEQSDLEDTLNTAISDSKNTSIQVVDGDKKTAVDSYAGKSADIGDMKQFGNGPGASTAGWIGHVVAEQHAGQTQSLYGVLGYTVAHQAYGIPAEEGATGYSRGTEQSHLTSTNDVVNGSITVPYTRGNQVVNVTTQFKDGNVAGVQRN